MLLHSSIVVLVAYMRHVSANFVYPKRLCTATRAESPEENDRQSGSRHDRHVSKAPGLNPLATVGLPMDSCLVYTMWSFSC